MWYKIVRLAARILTKLLFWFKEVNRPKNLPNERLVVCGNHTSNWDPVILLGSFPGKLNLMAKKELFAFKPIAAFLRSIDSFPVDRQALDREALKRANQVLEEDNILGLFPEGTRVKRGEMSRENFNNGIAMFSVKNNANIMPVTIKGTFRLFSRVEVIYGDIIEIDKIEAVNRRELYEKIVDEVYKSIASNF